MNSDEIAAIRKTLENKSTDELRQAYQDGTKADQSAAEKEALRLELEQRKKRSNQFIMAVVAAVLMGALGAGGSWLQGLSDGTIVLAGAVFAVLGFLGMYIQGLMGQY